jgi:predicted Zn finger-like uncharacterized protein
MLIVCPNCTTSYEINAAAVGTAGRTVRCVRCKSTWFAAAPKPEKKMDAFVDGVIAEAEAQKETPAARDTAQPPSPPAAAAEAPADDFGGEPEHAIAGRSETLPAAENIAAPAEETAPPIEDVPSIEAPSLVPPADQPPLVGASSVTDVEDVESFAARRNRLRTKRQNKRRSSRWTAIILVLAAFNVAMVGARNEVVRYLPQTASLFAAIGLPVNLRNLKFENVKISKRTENGVATLLVDGTIVSTGNSPTEVPRLRLSVRNAGGQEIYTWAAQPTKLLLQPGEKLDFHTRLASPPADAADVLVRFYNAQDAAAGLK